MRAMILAAGRGERMRELTTYVPKPLLRVSGHYLIEYSLANVKRAGIEDIVINVSYHAEQIKKALGNGERYGVNILYSEEKTRLETGGGILQALPLLGKDPFLVISSDIITDYPLKSLPTQLEGLAHLMMVSNPAYHPQGDFGLRDKKIDMVVKPTLTFANIGIYHPDLFANCLPGQFRLSKLLIPAIQAGKVTGELYQGTWYNIGTPEDYTAINQLQLTPLNHPSY